MPRWKTFLSLSALVLACTSCGGPETEPDAGTPPEDGAVEPDAGPMEVCSTDAECDDALFCNGAETCVEGQCEAATAPSCDDGIECTTDRCDEALRECTSEPPDVDRDGVADASCRGVDGLPLGRDCDDNDGNRFPGNPEICDLDDHDEDCDPSTFGFRDSDMDGFGDSACCNVDADGARVCGDDCNDTRGTVRPGLAEVCDEDDNDCDGSTDEGVLRTFYVDADGDGRGDGSMPSVNACFLPSGYAEADGDCDDTNSGVRPGTPELCDEAGLDEDCDGEANPVALCTCSGSESDMCTEVGACQSGIRRCSAGLWGACSIAPISEVCNSIDDDCDGFVDETLRVTCYADTDDDGYAIGAATETQECPVGGRPSVGGCPIGMTNRAPLSPDLDCNEGVTTTYPGAPELCNGIDDNCDAEADEGLTTIIRYIDMDGDGREGQPVDRCEGDPDSVPFSLDCDESSTDVYVGAPELCDRIDNNCDLGGGAAGGVDVSEDQDNDGYAPIGASCSGGTLPTTDCDDSRAEDHPGAAEVCSGSDTDCDTRIDEDPEAFLSCTAANSSAGCAMDATCRVFACDAGWGDCNGDFADGCEVDTSSDVNHCGGCGNRCGGNAPCVDGLCDRIARIEGSYDAHCLLFSSGQMTCAGDNTEGRLGDLTTTTRNVHVPTTGITNVVDFDYGSTFVCYVRADGTVACRGNNNYGQLGSGSGIDWDPTLHEVVGLTGAVVDVEASAFAVCARQQSGAVQCWGSIASGLGDSAATVQNSTAVTLDTLTDATGLGGFGGTMCAVRAGGTVVCWGNNAGGQLGDGDTTASATPVTVPGVSGAEEVVVGEGHACARLSDGTVTCWGDDSQGQLGDAASNATPQGPSVVPGLSMVTQISAGRRHTCVLHSGGNIACWGENRDGQIGNDSTVDAQTPTAPNGLGDGFDDVLAAGRQFTAESGFTCARAGSRVHCWGDNAAGMHGLGHFDDSDEPVPLNGLGRVAEVVGHSSFLCARRTDGDLACWGDNGFGQLAQGTLDVGSHAPLYVSGLVARDIDTEAERACAVEPAGTVACWGRLPSGHTGTPTPLAGITDAVQVRSGNLTSCVLHSGGGVSCWGDNGLGQFGDGSSTSSNTPVSMGVVADVHRIAVSRSHTCALQRNGHLYCSGWNIFGQTGGGNTDTSNDPQRVIFFDDFVDVAVAHGTTCAVRATGQLYCWGNYPGADPDTPVEITGIPAGRILAVDMNERGAVCVTLDIPPPVPSRPTLCWNGENVDGEMGAGNFTPVADPTQVLNFTDFDSVTLGGGFACGPRNQQSEVACWGRGGRNGTGSTLNAPATIANFP